MTTTESISVVVCVKNEEMRIEDCLRCVTASRPDEIIVVDGDSTDHTAAIARRFTDRVIVTKGSNFCRDRQIGIDLARSFYIAMIDADHRPAPADLTSLLADLKKYGLDIVQSQLISHYNHGFWNAAEEEFWEITHNLPGPRRMIGTAPAIFKRTVFDKVRFDDHITTKMDDTDFMYRLSHFPELKVGIGDTRIRQLHFASFRTYVRKFLWYGRGDAEFCRKHPRRAAGMLFHLLVRYPWLYPLRALRRGKWKAVPFCMLQGYVRAGGLVSSLAR